MNIPHRIGHRQHMHQWQPQHVRHRCHLAAGICIPGVNQIDEGRGHNQIHQIKPNQSNPSNPSNQSNQSNQSNPSNRKKGSVSLDHPRHCSQPSKDQKIKRQAWINSTVVPGCHGSTSTFRSSHEPEEAGECQFRKKNVSSDHTRPCIYT